MSPNPHPSFEPQVIKTMTTPNEQPGPEADIDEHVLPCPFCGCDSGRPEHSSTGDWTVECQTCGSGSGTHSERELAVTAWNARNDLCAVLNGRGLDVNATVEKIEKQVAEHLARSRQSAQEEDTAKLLTECIADWRKLKLLDYSAMVVVAMIVAPVNATDYDIIRRAKEVIAKHPEWNRAARTTPATGDVKGSR